MVMDAAAWTSKIAETDETIFGGPRRDRDLGHICTETDTETDKVPKQRLNFTMPFLKKEFKFWLITFDALGV